MAFILVFTFAFINPLTVSKSYAVVPVLTIASQRIIAGILVSAGMVITAGTTLAEADYESAITAISSLVYRTLDGTEKIALAALSIIDNVVEIPIALYNSISTKARQLFDSDAYSTLSDQGISIKYLSSASSDSDYPPISIPIYENASWITGNEVTRTYDFRQAQPVLVYDGSLVEGEIFKTSGIISNVFLNSEEYYTIPNYTGAWTSISSNLANYDCFDYTYINGTSYPARNLTFNHGRYDYDVDFRFLYNTGNITVNAFSIRNLSNIVTSKNINNCLIYVYLLKQTGSSNMYYAVDYYDAVTKDFLGQSITYSTGKIDAYNNDSLTTMPADVVITPEVETTPVVPNADATSNVLTLPTDVSGTIGLTSTDVNVGATTDTPGTDIGTGENTGTAETTGLLQKILDVLMALGDYILEGIKHIFIPDVALLDDMRDAIEEKFPIIDELKGIVDDIVSILTNKYTEPPSIIIPLSKAESEIDYGSDCITMDLSWYQPYKEKVDLVIIGFAYIFFAWRLYYRLPGIISGADGINWSVFTGDKTSYSGSGNFGFKPGGGKK